MGFKSRVLNYVNDLVRARVDWLVREEQKPRRKSTQAAKKEKLSAGRNLLRAKANCSHEHSYGQPELKAFSKDDYNRLS